MYKKNAHENADALKANLTKDKFEALNCPSQTYP